MRLHMVALLALAACGPSILPPGTRVPLETLQAQRDDLDGYIAAALERGEGARAYFALDLRKTRPYAIQQLQARARDRDITPDLRDLRPLFAQLIAAEAEGRSAQLVSRANRRASKVEARRDDAYWRHLRLFEKRVNALNPQTSGLPYSYAARAVFGASSAEESGLLFGPREAFLTYFVRGEALWALLIRGGDLVVEKLPTPTSKIRRVAAGLLAALRTAPAGGDDSDWKLLATRAYDMLLGPLATRLTDLDSLLISPDGFLANIPFAALLEPAAGGASPLIERVRISYIASASVYRQLLARPILNEPPRLLAVGNTRYPAPLAPLPFAEREAVTVSEIFPGSRLLRGRAASESRVIALAPRFNILHFATHGVLLGRLKSDASSLLVTADGGNDGFLNAAEIARLDLSSTYVAVLSACETSVSDTAGRSVDLGTLTNAFLGAGAPTVIGTMWQVSDEGTTVLMLEFYRQFLEVGAGAALQKAMLALRSKPRFAHPYYWAPFALYGWDK